jgi:hypothetical protein
MRGSPRTIALADDLLLQLAEQTDSFGRRRRRELRCDRASMAQLAS